MSKFKKISKISTIVLLAFIAVVIIYFSAIIIVASVQNYKPTMKEKLFVNEGKNMHLFADEDISIMSWNIGYVGLGSEMDFFYEGGKLMGPSRNLYQKYINGVFNTVSKWDTLDFIMLQEVDFGSKRTFFDNQDSVINTTLPYFSSVQGINYKVPFIPFPILNPMGKVLSGMMSLSKFIPDSAFRVSYPGSYSWPMSVFFLDRCFLMTVFDIDNGKQLLLVNTHNSAYDDAADIRITEMQFLKSFLLDWYSRGNYVIVGGDWNSNPPGFNEKKITTNDKIHSVGFAADKNFMPNGWQWIWDETIPSNRNVNTAYKKGQTLCTIIDYFLCSPNVKVNKIKTINNEFCVSDHNPIYLNISLIPDSSSCDSLAIYELMKNKISKEKRK